MLKRTIKISLSLLVLTFCINAQTQLEMTRKACDKAGKAEVKMNQMYKQILSEYKVRYGFYRKV